jgi:hypothetical protein
MTRIKYLGPSASVNIEPFGSHARGQEKDYPDDFAAELLATSRKQRFEMAPVQSRGRQEAATDEPAAAPQRARKTAKKG